MFYLMHLPTCVVHLFDGTDRRDVVGLSAPLVVAVVLPPVRHVPHILTAPEVIVLESHPSIGGRRRTAQNVATLEAPLRFVFAAWTSRVL